MKKIFIIIIWTLVSCNTDSISITQDISDNKNRNEETFNSDLITEDKDPINTVANINSNHENWDKKTVKIQGIISMGYEHITLNSDSIPENEDFMDHSIWINDFDCPEIVDKWKNKTNLKALVNKKVKITGLFEHVKDKPETNQMVVFINGFGHLNSWKAQLSKIKKIEEIE